jgi:hypothetical protein
VVDRQGASVKGQWLFVQYSPPFSATCGSAQAESEGILKKSIKKYNKNRSTQVLILNTAANASKFVRP